MMKNFTLRSQFYTPTHFNLITNNNNPSFPKSQPTKTPPKSNLLNTPLFLDSKRLKITPKSIKLSTQVDPLIPYQENSSSSSYSDSRFVIVGAVSVGLMMLLMGTDDHQKALAFGPEGPLMEDFWDNMRRYGLYALTVSTGVLYAVFQPLYELLKNPISAILVLTILGGGFYIVSQVVSAMVGITDFSYEYN